MLIDPELCLGCQACQPYCPVGAIADDPEADQPISRVDQDLCVECGVCLRSGVCPVQALVWPELPWPRSLRAAFSDPTATHRSTNEPGRGTEEMKTNDVTGRFTPGLAGVAIEMGRPGVATSFRDLELMAQAVAGAGVEFEPANPVTAIMADRKTGRLDPAVVGERALSAIIELVVPLERLGLVLEKVKATAPRLKTVFSLDVISLVHPDGSIPTRPILEAAGFTARPNAKTNVGLGRPLKPVRF